MIFWAYPSPQPKWHLDQFSRFCTDDLKVSLYFTRGRPPPKKKMPDLDPHLIHGSLPTWVLLNPNGISIGLAIFAGTTSETNLHVHAFCDQECGSCTTARVSGDRFGAVGDIDLGDLKQEPDDVCCVLYLIVHLLQQKEFTQIIGNRSFRSVSVIS